MSLHQQAAKKLTCVELNTKIPGNFYLQRVNTSSRSTNLINLSKSYQTVFLVINEKLSKASLYNAQIWSIVQNAQISKILSANISFRNIHLIFFKFYWKMILLIKFHELNTVWLVSLYKWFNRTHKLSKV